MEISMPSNDKTITEEQQTTVKASQAITLLLGADNKLYYYEGEPNYKDYTSPVSYTHLDVYKRQTYSSHQQRLRRVIEDNLFLRNILLMLSNHENLLVQGRSKLYLSLIHISLI